MLPLQIPALRHSSMDARSDSGAQRGSTAQQSAASRSRNPLSGKGRIPYVKLCGLRLPDTLTPAVDEPHEAQVGACTGTSWLGLVLTAEPQSPWQKVLPPGRTLGRTPSTLLLELGKSGICISLQAAVVPGVAEHAREAGEDMTDGRTLLGRFCREHCLGCRWTCLFQGHFTLL